jgi:hypothetical protein
MRTRTLVAALTLALPLLGLAGCADDAPPGFINELGAPSTTSAPTTTVPPTTSTTAPAAGATTTTAGAETAVTDLVAGNCVAGEPFAGQPTGEATDTQLADCNGPHDGEVVGVVTYTQGPAEPYPGQGQVSTYAEEQCAIAFEAYVGVAYGTNALSMVSLWPTEDSWVRGDREAVCVAFQPDAPLNGSIAGSAAGA